MTTEATKADRPELFGWKRIDVEGTCDACCEHQQLRYEWPETEAWLCAECWHEATEMDRLRAENERLRERIALLGTIDWPVRRAAVVETPTEGEQL